MNVTIELPLLLVLRAAIDYVGIDAIKAAYRDGLTNAANNPPAPVASEEGGGDTDTTFKLRDP